MILYVYVVAIYVWKIIACVHTVINNNTIANNN